MILFLARELKSLSVRIPNAHVTDGVDCINGVHCQFEVEVARVSNVPLHFARQNELHGSPVTGNGSGIIQEESSMAW
jgi:hypothetical protein